MVQPRVLYRVWWCYDKHLKLHELIPFFCFEVRNYACWKVKHIQYVNIQYVDMNEKGRIIIARCGRVLSMDVGLLGYIKSLERWMIVL